MSSVNAIVPSIIVRFSLVYLYSEWALDITDDTPVVASIKDGRITVEIVDEDELYDEDFCEDDTCECADDCEYCEYYCPHCKKCVLDE